MTFVYINGAQGEGVQLCGLLRPSTLNNVHLFDYFFSIHKLQCKLSKLHAQALLNVALQHSSPSLNVKSNSRDPCRHMHHCEANCNEPNALAPCFSKCEWTIRVVVVNIWMCEMVLVSCEFHLTVAAVSIERSQCDAVSRAVVPCRT